MGIELGSIKKSLIGHHNRTKNTFRLVENKYPLFDNENESLFLLTRDHFFSITSPQIDSVLTNFLRYRDFHRIKRLVADVFVVLGVFIAFGFILKYATLLDGYDTILKILSSKPVNVLFGISIFAIIILWHDFYEDKSHPVQMPKVKKIPQKDIDEIKGVGFKFGRYVHLDIISFANEELLEILCMYYKNGSVDLLGIYEELIDESYEVKQILRRAGLQLDSSVLQNENIQFNELENISVSALRDLFVYIAEEGVLSEASQLGLESLFLAITKVVPDLSKYLQKNNINLDILREVCVYEYDLIRRKKRGRYLDPNVPYFRKGGIANQWIYGYTFILSHFSKEINKEVAESPDIFGIGHDEEVDAIISVLGKLANKNALLIGEPGVGKSSIILGLAQRINYADVPEQLRSKRIIQLDLNNLVATAQKYSNLEELVIKTMKELEKAGNTILYIDEIQQLIPSKEGDSGYNLAGILLPYVLNSKFPIIGTINYADYKKFFYSNESLRQSFTNIEIKEISANDAMKILESKVPVLEKNFNCFLTFPALAAAVDISQRYIKDRKLPSSAVQTIEATCAWAQSNGVEKVTAEHVSKAVSLQKNINITAIDQEESNRLMKLEENIRSRVVGQDEAVTAIAEALRRARTDIRNPNKPIGTFLFMGPTGVGKTHVAKVVAEEFFNVKDSMIRVDMSEYQDVSSVEKFLGSSSGGGVLGQESISLIDKIKSNPHSVVLFDEIEKAAPSILDLFLQIFDDGILTSSLGETVDFTNAIIICTSNIGSKILLDSLNQKDVLWEEAESRALLELRQSIKPELLNRFDKIIVFAPHDLNNLSKIATLLLTDLAKRLLEKGITVTWSEQIPMLIANKSNEPGFGARPMRRYIQDKIEGQIAKGIIEQQVKPGEEIVIKESWIT
ncbi:MAG: AAA family ATPase [Candidatus Dojkabacteria bacterium]|jgi:ATP-dependent Clp protease ATP-binding subunit ClpC